MKGILKYSGLLLIFVLGYYLVGFELMVINLLFAILYTLVERRVR